MSDISNHSQFRAENPERGAILTITQDGKLEIGPGYTMTEAGEALINTLIQYGVTVIRNDSTHTIEFRNGACTKHFFSGHKWWCRKCDADTEDAFRQVCHALWRLQGAGDRIVQ